jgi:exonuclease III
MTHRWAELNLPEAGIRLAALHAPHDSPGQASASTARAAFFSSLVATARRHASEPFVLLGDFNAGRHYADEAGATLTCTYQLGVLASLGYIDAWRRFNPHGREYSWFSPDGGGFRIDHALVSAPLAGRLRSCEYSHVERQRNLSDHAVLTLSVA